jgi:hypothetical protein
VSDKIAECSNQILAEKENTLLKFQKVNHEIEILKAGLASKQTSETLSVKSVNMKQNHVAKIAKPSQGTITPTASVGSNNVTDQGSVSEVICCNNVSTYDDVTYAELSHVNNTAVLNTTSDMPINQDSLRELSLPSFLDSNKQSVVTFLRDLDMYFEIKKVPENLKLPLVLRAIKEPFAQNWVSSEYHKIDSYQSFKAQFSKLFWNELEQSRVRCEIYQGRYDRNGGESMTEHYVRYASLAANLQPPLTEYDLVTALTSHFSMEIQRAMLAANLKSSQEALAFLGRMQSLENSREAYKKSKQENNSKDFERRQQRGGDRGGGNSYRETPREVRHVRYGYQQGSGGSPYRQRTQYRGRNYQTDRRNAQQTRELNPQIPEFQPRNRGARRESEEAVIRAERSGGTNHNQEN